MDGGTVEEFEREYWFQAAGFKALQGKVTKMTWKDRQQKGKKKSSKPRFLGVGRYELYYVFSSNVFFLSKTQEGLPRGLLLRNGASLIFRATVTS